MYTTERPNTEYPTDYHIIIVWYSKFNGLMSYIKLSALHSRSSNESLACQKCKKWIKIINMNEVFDKHNLIH